MKTNLRIIFALALFMMTTVLYSCGASEGAEPPVDEVGSTVTDEQGLLYTLKENGSYAVEASGDITAKRLVIPKSINGRSVTEIAKNAFSYVKILFEAEEVVIPESITKIGESAFSGASSIRSVYINDLTVWCSVDFGNAYSNPLGYADSLYVNDGFTSIITIPDGVSKISDYAFAYFGGIRRLYIPDSVSHIGKNAFANCSSLRLVDIGSGLQSIGGGIFTGCSNLTDLINKSNVDVKEGLTQTMDTLQFNKAGAQMVGHAGLASREMQNTIEAFEYAARRSYFGIETDIRKTLDGHFVCFHDADLIVAAGIESSVEKMTLEEIRNVTLFDVRGGETKERGYKIPTLEEYIEICKKYSKECFVELKVVYPKEDIAAIIEVIDSLGYLDRCTFISFYYSDLTFVKEIIPDARVGFTYTANTGEQYFERIVSDRFDVNISVTIITEELIKRFHDSGLKVTCYTVNDPARAEELAQLGVDFIMTDRLE